MSGLGFILACSGLGACNTTTPTVTGSIPGRKPAMVVSDAERDCLGRAMYFESNRTDEAGLLAVGTVVMNRMEAAVFPNGICDVVGQPRQFAPGVLTKKMRDKDLPKVADVADAVLAGERHPQVGRAMYFHTAGHRFPYNNMHYVAAAGGNVFYEKRKPGAAAKPETRPPETPALETTFAAAPAQTDKGEHIPDAPASDICTVAAAAPGASHG